MCQLFLWGPWFSGVASVMSSVLFALLLCTSLATQPHGALLPLLLKCYSYVSPISAGICVCCVSGWFTTLFLSSRIWMTHSRCSINICWIKDLSFHLSEKPFPENLIPLLIYFILPTNLKSTGEEPGHLGSKPGSTSPILGSLYISPPWNWLTSADPTLRGGFKDHARNECRSALVQEVLIILVTVTPSVFRNLLSAYLSSHDREPRRKKKHPDLTKPIP